MVKGLDSPSFKVETGEANLNSLNKLIVRVCDDIGMEASKRLKHLKLTDLAPTREDYPVLKHVKGAKIRWFTPVCVEMCKLYQDSREDKHRLAMVKNLQNLYTLMEEPWKKWNKAKGEAFLKEANNMLQHYSFLATQAMKNGQHLYSMAQKHHMLLQLGEQAEHLHPRTTWCYGSESFMSIAKSIGSACTRGTPGHKVAYKVLQKFKLVFHLYLEGHYNLSDEIPSEEESEG